MDDGEPPTGLDTKNVLLDPRVYPAYASIASILFVVLHFLANRVISRRRLSNHDRQEEALVKSNPSASVVAFKAIRLVACLAFLAAVIDGLVGLDEEERMLSSFWFSGALILTAVSLLLSELCMV